MTESELKNGKPFYRTIRSFVKREGKMTTGQKNAVDELWPRFGVNACDDQIDFAALFARQAPVVMEIGFGNGLSLAAMAEKELEMNFFGVEVHMPGVGSLLVQTKKLGLENIRVSCEDAVEVLKHVPEKSLDRMQVFFPDPWHKKRHHKRRLIQPEFVETVLTKLKQGGIFHVATDWENYAEQVLEVLSACSGLKNKSVSLGGTEGYSPKPDYRPETKYERRGLNLGHGVWDLLFEKQ